MKMIKFFIVIFILASILSGCSTQITEIIPSGNIGSEVGDIAADFSLMDIDGNEYTLSQFKGTPVIISFFATWCIPCQIESNNIKIIDDESTNKFEVFHIGVDNKERVEDLVNYKNNYGNPDWIVGFGIDIATNYNVRSLDTTFIVNKEGIIVYRDNGVPASLKILKGWLV